MESNLTAGEERQLQEGDSGAASFIGRATLLFEVRSSVPRRTAFCLPKRTIPRTTPLGGYMERIWRSQRPPFKKLNGTSHHLVCDTDNTRISDVFE